MMDSRRTQYVLWNMEQGLSDSEKAQGRNNIGAAALASLAPAFSTSTAYNKGSVVTYNGALYIFDSAHAAGAWTGADAHEVTILEVIISMRIAEFVMTDADGNGIIDDQGEAVIGIDLLT